MSVPPPPPPSAPMASAGGQPPDNYLVWSILTTVLCCLPLGIASIVFSTQVNSKWAMGDIQGAMDSSRKAKSFAMWSAIAGVVGGVLYALLWFFVISAGTLTYN